MSIITLVITHNCSSGELAVFPYFHKPVTSKINDILHVIPTVLKEAICAQMLQGATDSTGSCCHSSWQFTLFLPFPCRLRDDRIPVLNTKGLELLHWVLVTVGQRRLTERKIQDLADTREWFLRSLQMVAGDCPRAHRLESQGTLTCSLLGSNCLVYSASMGVKCSINLNESPQYALAPMSVYV